MDCILAELHSGLGEGERGKGRWMKGGKGGGWMDGGREWVREGGIQQKMEVGRSRTRGGLKYPGHPLIR